MSQRQLVILTILSIVAWVVLVVSLLLLSPYIVGIEYQIAPLIAIGVSFTFLLFSNALMVYRLFVLRRQRRNHREFLETKSRTFQSTLSSIKVAGASLLRYLSEGKTEDAKEMGSYIHSQTARLQEIGNQISNKKKPPLIEALNKRPISLRVFFDHCVRDMEIKYAHRPVNISIDLNPDDLHMNADPFYLKTAILNILDNSFQYNEEDEDLFIEITAQKINDQTQISISDNGKGVDHSELAHLGQKYYRPKQHMHIIGLGLGLFQAKQIVGAHGGAITFQGDTTAGFAVHITIDDE